MRVLLLNPGYPETFWSMNRVLKMVGRKVVQPPLGLITLAALLPQDWEFTLVELTAGPVSEEQWAQCELVMVSGMTVQYGGMLAAVREAKRRDKVVVVGGPLAFHLPQQFLEAGADLVVTGEAERAIPLLHEALQARRTGLIIREPSKPELSESVRPRFDLLDFRYYATMAVQFSRGCPFHCEFCDITLLHGRRVRTKPPRQMLAELQALYDLGWHGTVFVVDDNFIGIPGQTKAFLKELIPWMKERHYPFEFATQASVNVAADPRLLDLLVQAGFFMLFLGIETEDVQLLRLAQKPQNIAINLDEACAAVTRAGIQIMAGCIIGLDHEPRGVDQRVIDFAARNHLPEVLVTPLQAGPGTDLWQRLEQENRHPYLESSDLMGTSTGMINFVPTRPMTEILEELIRAYEVLYEPGNFIERVTEHLSRMPRPAVNKPFRLPSWRELRAVLIVLFRQGVLYPSRGKFWKGFSRALTKFPGRFTQFMTLSIVGEHYAHYRRTIAQQLRTRLGEPGAVAGPADGAEP